MSRLSKGAVHPEAAALMPFEREAASSDMLGRSGGRSLICFHGRPPCVSQNIE